MARPGVSYLDIAQTATKLVKQNIRPSIEEVRKVLGTGSNSTINRHLRVWREKQGNQLEAEQGLPDVLLIAVKGIYEAIEQQATQKIDSAKTEYTETINRLTQHRDQLILQNTQRLQQEAELENQLSEAQHREVTLQKQLNELTQGFDKKMGENSSLQDRLGDKENEITRLTQQLNHAQHNLDHYREATREQRENEKQRYDGELNKLEKQLHQQNALTTQAQEQVLNLTQQLESLKQHHQHGEKKLEKAIENCHQQEFMLQRQELNYKSLLECHEQMKTQHNALLDESTSDKDRLSALSIKFEKTLERVESLKVALRKAEDRINYLNDKNLFLTQEKTELASQLKLLGSLNLMNKGNIHASDIITTR